MKEFNRELAEKALECCSITGRDMCENCPLKEECESSPFESVIAKYAFELVKRLKAELNVAKDVAANAVHGNEELIAQRDSFRDYAYNMQAYVESVRNYDSAGYPPSASRYAAEMDMWNNVALQKRAMAIEADNWRRTAYESLSREDELRRELERLAAENIQLKEGKN